MNERKHLNNMNLDELSRVICQGYEDHPCSNTLEEYGCRNNMKDDEALCSQCCSDTLEDSNIECCG